MKTSSTLVSIAVQTVLAALLATPAMAQYGSGPPTIETEGTATVEVAPDFAEFYLKHASAAPSLAKATELAQQFGTRLREALEERDISPAELEISEPIVNAKANKQKAAACEVRVTARVRFDTAAFHEGAEGYVEFGSLCDKMRGLSQTVGCTFSGPRLGVYDPRQTERVAISKAIEEAYPSAEAAAHIMPAHIVSVQRVNVEEVSWDKSEDWRGAGPGLRRSVCTARVRVTYVFATGP